MVIENGMANFTSATPSLARPSNIITPQPMSTQQRHCQQDLAVMSCHGQRGLGSAIASKTQQRRHATANIDSTVSSPTRLDNDITPWPTSTRHRHRQQDSAATSSHGQCRHGNAITSKTRQRHHTTTNVDSVEASPARLKSDITPRPTWTQQRHR
jgi:hypothetical protein